MAPMGVSSCHLRSDPNEMFVMGLTLMARTETPLARLAAAPLVIARLDLYGNALASSRIGAMWPAPGAVGG